MTDAQAPFAPVSPWGRSSRSSPLAVGVGVGGSAGAWFADVFFNLFGYVAYCVPLMVGYLAWMVFRGSNGTRSGLNLQAMARSWGEYWMDNANTEKYEGYRLVTDLSLGYRGRRFEAAFIVQNLFGQRYAVEAQKDLYGGYRYSPAAPTYALLRFAVKF